MIHTYPQLLTEERGNCDMKRNFSSSPNPLPVWRGWSPRNASSSRWGSNWCEGSITSKLLSAHLWQTKDPCGASHTRALRLGGPLHRDRTGTGATGLPLLLRHELLVMSGQLRFNQMKVIPEGSKSLNGKSDKQKPKGSFWIKYPKEEPTSCDLVRERSVNLA